MKLIIFIALSSFCSIFCIAQEKGRIAVETLTDGFTPNFDSVKNVSVKDISQIRRVTVHAKTPRLDMEKQLVEIVGILTAKKTDENGDLLIEVADPSVEDTVFFCVAVNPKDPIAAKSPFAPKFKAVYDTLNKLKPGARITFTGMEYQNMYKKENSYRTKNFIEMHPILSVK